MAKRSQKIRKERMGVEIVTPNCTYHILCSIEKTNRKQIILSAINGILIISIECEYSLPKEPPVAKGGGKAKEAKKVEVQVREENKDNGGTCVWPGVFYKLTAAKIRLIKDSI